MGVWVLVDVLSWFIEKLCGSFVGRDAQKFKDVKLSFFKRV